MLVKGIKNSFICMAVVILSIAFMDGVTEQSWERFGFYTGILLMGVCFSIWQFILQKIEFRLYLLEVFVNFLGTLVLALVLGRIFDWYSDIQNVGYVCIEVFLAFVIGYFLGLTKTRGEVRMINQALEKRKQS